MQGMRSRVLLAPLQIGLAVLMHHHFSSRFIIDTLNKLGFCSSYSEVLRFEKCAAVSENQGPKDVPENSCLHYVADNVDHDSCAIDGRGTFHGIGILSAITPVPGKVSRFIPRKEVSAEDIKAVSFLSFHFYNRARQTSPNVLYKPLLS
jgi:hypothetical protein